MQITQFAWSVKTYFLEIKRNFIIDLASAELKVKSDCLDNLKALLCNLVSLGLFYTQTFKD